MTEKLQGVKENTSVTDNGDLWIGSYCGIQWVLGERSSNSSHYTVTHKEVNNNSDPFYNV